MSVGGAGTQSQELKERE